MSTFKRILAMVLALVLVFTSCPVAAQAEEPETTVDTGDLTVEGSNRFGNLLSQKLAEYQEESESDYEAGYAVTDLTVEGNLATVEYSSLEDAILVVALYSEDGLQMLASGDVLVKADEDLAYVTIEGNLPEYFLASAYLMDTYNLSPMCEAYDTPMYTREMQELLASTVDDYDTEKVLNLDDDDTTNFAVYADSTIIIQGGDGVNTVASVDDENYVYVIENADESITGLQTSDVFVYPYGEGEILIVKVASTAVNGTTVTVTGQKLEMEDAFQIVKIDGQAGTEDFTVDDSTADEGISYVGVSKDENGDIAPHALEGGDTTTVSHEFKVEVEEEESVDGVSASVTASGALKFKIDVGVKYYISLNTQYVEFKVTPSVEFALTLKGKLVFSKEMGYLAVSPVPGVYVGFEPKLELEFDCNISFKETLNAVIGFKYDSASGVQNISKKPEFKPELKVEGKVFVGVDFCPQVAILDDTISEIEVNMLVGFEVKGTAIGTIYEPNKTDGSQQHQCKECLDMDVSFVAKLGGTLKFLEQDWLTVNITIGAWTIPLGSMYWSVDYDEFGFGTCPHFTYMITFIVRDSEGNHIPNKEIMVSSLDEELITNENGVVSAYVPSGTCSVSVAFENSTVSKQILVDSSQKVIISEIKKKIPSSGDDDGGDAENWWDDIDFGGILDREDLAEIKDEVPVASGSCGDNINWALYGDGVLTISGTGNMYDYGSTDSTPWFYEDVSSVIIRSGVTSIGEYAFANSYLTHIEIPDSVNHIGRYAFSNCLDLNEISLPDGITVIEEGTFAYSGLNSITIPGTVTEICGDAFDLCEDLASISIPASVKYIGEYAFYGCESLSEITLPNGITKIEEGTFAFSGLHSISVPDTVVEIDCYAFNSCENLTEITIPESVTFIGKYAFEACNSLRSIEIPGSVTKMEACVFFDCENLNNVVIQNGLTRIEDETFAYSGLNSITIPNSVTEIGEFAFAYCESLCNITLPNSINAIESSAFEECTGLMSISIPDGVTVIEDCLFSGCVNLSSVTMPNTVTSIEDDAFYKCSDLGFFTIPQSVSTIGGYAFSESGITEITVPNSVTSIGSSAFSICKKLTDVKLSSALTDLENGMFEGCINLKNVDLPNCLESIGVGAFWDCESLSHITIPDSVATIYDSAFYGCSSLKNIRIPAGVTDIDWNTFERCTNLSYVVIPASITWIGMEAFLNCANLTDVYYADSDSSWAQIEIDEDGNEYLLNATIHFNSTGPDDDIGEVRYSQKWDDENQVAYFDTDPKEDIHNLDSQVTKETESIGIIIDEITNEQTPTPNSIYGGDYSTEVTDTYTLKLASFTGLVPGEQYVLLAMKSIAVDNPLAADNLLFIDQAVAPEDGTLVFRYVQRTPVDVSYVVACGASNKDLADAEISFPEMTADGELQAVNPAVLYDGKPLVEGQDYTIVGTVSFIEAGTYTCCIRGVRNYTGLVECTYTVAEGNTYLPGDINGDGNVNARDVTKLLQYLADWDVEVVEAALDVNDDGKVNARDVTLLKQYIAGWDVELF